MEDGTVVSYWVNLLHPIEIEMESTELANKRTPVVKAKDKIQEGERTWMMVQGMKKLSPECRGISKNQIKKHEFDVGCKFVLNMWVSLWWQNMCL